jgi:peptidoglycan/LPS O-acetylase OafA/YrhL
VDKKLSQFIDLSRWLAAYMVVLGHTRQWLLTDLPNVAHPSLMWKLAYLITGEGHEAVVVFFVVSGYLVGGLSVIRANAGKFDKGRFWAHRVSRIFTAFVPALVVGFAMDLIGSHFAPQLYQSLPVVAPAYFPAAAVDHLSFTSFLGNLFMLQTIVVPTFGSNGPLWSLACEWWYYVVFGLALSAYGARSNKRWLFAVGAIAVAIALPLKILLSGSIWCVGLATALICRRPRVRIHPAIGLAVFIATLLVSRYERSGGGADLLMSAFDDLVVGVGFSFLIYCVASRASGVLMGSSAERANSALASFSYSTYLIHYPILMLVVCALSAMHHPLKVQPSASAMLALIPISVAIVGVTFFFYLLAERHTDVVRGYAERLFMGRAGKTNDRQSVSV